MGPLKWFLCVYLFGGITFLPLVLVSAFVYLYLTSPPVPPPQQRRTTTTRSANNHPQSPVDVDKYNDDIDPAGLIRDTDDKDVFRSGTDDLAEKFHRRHDGDVAAGYFAVSREFVPGGIVRARPPPDRAAPVAGGEGMISESSPSVYQAMYRTIFDRPQKPSIEPQKEGVAARGAKKQGNNVFYLVLRHGHLMLYDDIQQLEVRYVISLDHHDVDIYSKTDEVIPEGELWSKRHAIRLQRKTSTHPADTRSSLPFFLFTEYTSDKEDFYFALLNNQRRTSDEAPEAQTFDVKHIVSLVQKLHSSEEHLATRWLNALIGRIFLALYRTEELEEFVRAKLMKKLSKVKKPNFITRLALRKVDLGTGAPFITNPRLKDLTVNGDCTVEADIDYAGNFKIELGATARIDLGTRFKPRDVDLVLSVTVKRVRGHGLLRVKPPPSNRVWIAFEKMPHLELAVEPIVSSRQITLTLVLRAIESRLREVFAESLVLPFWDDIPFYLTLDQKHRGGIWKREAQPPGSVEVKPELVEDDTVSETIQLSKDDRSIRSLHLNKEDRNMSDPVLSDVKRFRKSATALSDPLPSPPRLMRSSSIATVAGPKITIGHVDSDSARSDEQEGTKRDSASVALKDVTAKDLTARSQPGSVSESTPGSVSGSPPVESSMAMAIKAVKAVKARSNSQASQGSNEKNSQASERSNEKSLTPEDRLSGTSTPSSRPSSIHSEASGQKTPILDRKKAAAAVASAQASAQKWSNMGWGVLARTKQQQPPSQQQQQQQQAKKDAPTLPMGRGQPLPPPGQPLPPPQRPISIAGMANSMLARRRPVAVPVKKENDIKKENDNDSVNGSAHTKRKASPRPAVVDNDNDYDDEVLVVAAPIESQPPSPAATAAVEGDDYFDKDSSADSSDAAADAKSDDTPPPATPATPDQKAESADGVPLHHQAVEASNRERSLSYLEAASGGGGYNE